MEDPHTKNITHSVSCCPKTEPPPSRLLLPPPDTREVWKESFMFSHRPDTGESRRPSCLDVRLNVTLECDFITNVPEAPVD